MHLGSEEEITLLEFKEAEEGDQQENPQAAAPEGVEQDPEELPGVLITALLPSCEASPGAF